MTRMIRLMTYVVVAAAAPAAFAGQGARASGQKAGEEQAVKTARCECVDPPGEEAGGGRGELPGQGARMKRDPAAERAAAERRAREAAAIEEQERRTLEEIWTRP